MGQNVCCWCRDGEDGNDNLRTPFVSSSSSSSSLSFSSVPAALSQTLCQTPNTTINSSSSSSSSLPPRERGKEEEEEEQEQEDTRGNYYYIKKYLGQGSYAVCYLLEAAGGFLQQQSQQQERKEGEGGGEGRGKNKRIRGSFGKYLAVKQLKCEESDDNYKNAKIEFEMNKHIFSFGECEQIVKMHHLLSLDADATIFPVPGEAGGGEEKGEGGEEEEEEEKKKAKKENSASGSGGGAADPPPSPKKWFLVMEFCSGGSLEDYLDKIGFIYNEKHIHTIMHDLLQAVSFLHKKACIIHRDINPCNIMISTRGSFRVKLADFGFAIVQNVPSASPSSFSSEKGEVTEEECRFYDQVGRIDYMSPELLKKSGYSYPTDIWSVGVTLYAILFGKEPFYNPASINYTIQNIRDFKPNLQSEKEKKRAPQGWQNVMWRALHPAENKRITLDEMIETVVLLGAAIPSFS